MGGWGDSSDTGAGAISGTMSEIKRCNPWVVWVVAFILQRLTS
jgi:hypothetical protein